MVYIHIALTKKIFGILKNNARRYAIQYKNGKTQVLEVTISVSSDVYYIDLDDEEFKQKMESN